jgi:hypothetical protein
MASTGVMSAIYFLRIQVLFKPFVKKVNLPGGNPIQTDSRIRSNPNQSSKVATQKTWQHSTLSFLFSYFVIKILPVLTLPELPRTSIR